MATKQAQYASPQETSNRTFRIPLLISHQNRSSDLSKDQRLINCYAEVFKNEITESKKIYIVKRPGLSTRRTYTAGTGRGAFRWKGADYVAIGSTLYKDGTSHKTITGTSGHVGFEVVDDNGTEKLFFCDGTYGYVTDGTTVVTVPQTYSVWTVDTAMAVGNRRIPTAANGYYYEVVKVTGDTKTHAATEPTWPTVIDDLVVDDQVTWICAGYYGYAYAAWSTPRTPSVGAQVVPTSVNGYYYECTISGAVGGTEPIWPVTIGNTVSDGSATWECVGKTDTSNPMPKDHLPYPVMLDKTLYLVAKNVDGTNSQSIYSSDIRNPHSWNQVDFTDAEQYSDALQALVRHHGYIAAFGAESLEFFYDAANPTGSPLSRNVSLSLKIGCPAPETAKQAERILMFVGTTTNGGYGVWQIKDFTPKKVSNEGIDKVLDAEGTSIANARAYFIRISGHLFYVIRLTSQTLVYDLEENLWSEWSSNSSGSHVVFVGAYSYDLGDGTALILGNSNGILYTLGSNVYQDSSVDILMDIYTTKLDFESMNRKFLHSLSIVGDEISGQSLLVRWTDDDYVTWTAYFTVDISTSPMDLLRGGVFRRRAYNLRYIGNTRYRIEALEMNLSLGIS